MCYVVLRLLCRNCSSRNFHFNVSVVICCALILYRGLRGKKGSVGEEKKKAWGKIEGERRKRGGKSHPWKSVRGKFGFNRDMMENLVTSGDGERENLVTPGILMIFTLYFNHFCTFSLSLKPRSARRGSRQ